MLFLYTNRKLCVRKVNMREKTINKHLNHNLKLRQGMKVWICIFWAFQYFDCCEREREREEARAQSFPPRCCRLLVSSVRYTLLSIYPSISSPSLSICVQFIYLSICLLRSIHLSVSCVSVCLCHCWSVSYHRALCLTIHLPLFPPPTSLPSPRHPSQPGRTQLSLYLSLSLSLSLTLPDRIYLWALCMSQGVTQIMQKRFFAYYFDNKYFFYNIYLVNLISGKIFWCGIWTFSWHPAARFWCK